MSEKPLVSFIVFAYKQERFIREAVRSALAQTYEPLEILLSDDCSPDRTFEIMKEEAEAYRGPHKVILNRNPENAGLAAHVNRGFELTHGEFVVVQAGDDRSLPNRTERLAAAWDEEPAVDCVFSDCCVIDADGNDTGRRRFGEDKLEYSQTLEQVARTGSCWVAGCTAGYSRSIMSRFGPLGSAVVFEDNVLPFRAILGRGIRYLDEVFVQYRVHETNVFQGTPRDVGGAMSREQLRYWAADRAAVVEDWLRALKITEWADSPCKDRLDVLAWERRFDAESYLVSRLGSLRLAAQALRAGLSARKVGGLIKRHFFRITR